MLYRIRSVQDIQSLPMPLPQAVRDELLRSTAILEYEYGPIREDGDGGISIIVPEKDDLEELRGIIDYTVHPPEWVMLSQGYAIAMYLQNNEYTVTVYLPMEITPKEILDEMEEVSK